MVIVLAMMTSAGSAQTPDAARNQRATELTQRGVRLVERGDPGSAVWFLREALAVEPGHVPAAVALADVYLARGEPASARDVALQTIRRASADGALWLRLARSRFALDDSDGAMEALREGLRHVPRDTLLLQTLVEASLRRGEWSRALSAQRALWSEADTRHDVDHVSIESALRVLLATSDRARGLRCDASLSIVRRALSRCAAHP